MPGSENSTAPPAGGEKRELPIGKQKLKLKKLVFS